MVIDRLAESDPEGKGIAVDANSYRRCFAFVKSGLHLGVWKDMASRVDERRYLSGIPWQIYACATAGATRLEQGKVIEVKCAEA